MRPIFLILLALVGLAGNTTAQLLRSVDLETVRLNEMEQRPNGFFAATGTDAYLVWSDLRTALPAVGGVVLHLEFAEPLPTRTFWEFYWGSENEGFNRASMVYFTAGRAGDNRLALWLPLGEHPLYQHYPFGDLKELRLSPAYHFDRAFRIAGLELHQTRPDAALTHTSLHHFGTPEAFLQIDRGTRVLGRIMGDWAGRWSEDLLFVIGFFGLLLLLLLALRRLARRRENA
jgi:hypothetical protein